MQYFELRECVNNKAQAIIGSLAAKVNELGNYWSELHILYYSTYVGHREWVKANENGLQTPEGIKGRDTFDAGLFERDSWT